MTLQEMSPGNVYVTLIVTGAFAGIGVLMLVYGVTLSRRAMVPSHLRERWQRYIIPFLGRSAPDAIDADAIDADAMRLAERQWVRIHGGGMIGASVGILAGVAGMAAAMLAATQVPFGLPVSILSLFFAPVFWGILAGTALGEVVASRRRVSGTYDDGLTDGEPSRRVSDYRSPLVLLVVALPSVVFCALTLIVVPRFEAFPPHFVHKYGIIAPPRWILAIYPCLALVMLILAEICVWVKVKLIAAIRLRDAAIAHRLHVRAMGQYVGATYLGTMLLSTVMGAAVIVLYSLLSLDGVGFAVCMGISLILLAVCVGMLLPANRGQVGGRLTGWLWGDRAAQDDGAAEARRDGMV